VASSFFINPGCTKGYDRSSRDSSRPAKAGAYLIMRDVVSLSRRQIVGEEVNGLVEKNVVRMKVLFG
jgi:hypothetical protein